MKKSELIIKDTMNSLPTVGEIMEALSRAVAGGASPDTRLVNKWNANRPDGFGLWVDWDDGEPVEVRLRPQGGAGSAVSLADLRNLIRQAEAAGMNPESAFEIENGEVSGDPIIVLREKR